MVCKNCHGAATKIEKRKIKDSILGVLWHKTVKLKVGYKAEPKKPKAVKQTAKKKPSKKRRFDDWF